MADYREAPLATRPKTLDPNEYFNVSPEQRRAEAERAALRAGLKREYQLQLNNPHRKELIVSDLQPQSHTLGRVTRCSSDTTRVTTCSLSALCRSASLTDA